MTFWRNPTPRHPGESRGTLKELGPITTLDGKPVGRGTPGPITKTLLAAYRDRTGAA